MAYFRPARDAERRTWQNPEAILKQMGLAEGMTFADIGSGGGFFAIPAARVVGETGLVYALDASEGAVESLRETASREGLGNIRTIIGRAEKVLPCESCADIVFMGIDLHDFSDQAGVLRNALKTLKPGGKLVDVDFEVDAPFGPPVEIRLSRKKATETIESAGFRVTKVASAGPYHYLIEAQAGG